MPLGLVAWVGCAATAVLGAGGTSSEVEGRGARFEKPGPFACSVTLPVGRDGHAEPLLSVGTGGAGDVVFVYYHSAERISLGWEQPGWGVVYSDPLNIVPKKPHRLMLALGSLMPLAGDPLYLAQPEYAALRETLLVQLDGRTVLAAHGPFKPFTRGEAVVGANIVGGAVAEAFFSGRITDVIAVDPREALAGGSELTSFLGAKTADVPAGLQGQKGLNGYPGPVLIRLRFPRGQAGQAEPLVVTGATGAGDIVYIRYENDHRLRFGFDHWLVGGPISEPVEFDPDRTQEIVLSLGSMIPPAAGNGADAYAPLRGQCLLFFNGRGILKCSSGFYPSRPSQIMLANNPIGGSTAGPKFSGVIIWAESIRPEQMPSASP